MVVFIVNVTNMKVHPLNGAGTINVFFAGYHNGFKDFEKLLDVNQWNIDFLKSYHKELCPYLMEIFLVNQNNW